ncbi:MULTISPECIES: class I SAM-dependent methyltransferase [unclassified Synechococcus]|uniref:class I SAM-dependent methyltransferase n=1 Tax=unclassified Synechococcus TaxID=2626047 RepID=UPI000069847F|nr:MULTISPECIES: class I SAM-dependent methyltransferase [unclassified Synechococcus]EAQ75674.1 hypothetical protein WH5701_02474 [Synechococcus sp. WH 5701]MCP9824600.1 class I SAM-dependent methyltransferase [Synechococcus sp. EJ6-Ellesmere]WFN59649.1 class I SAM-dependent methyltransferase [Synechococcus sp. CCFWC 502]
MNISAISSGPVISSPPPPPWVDARTPLGRLIAAVLAVEPMRQLLFLQARRMMIRTAETRGIPWRHRREQLRQQAEPLLASSTEAAVVTPPYYRARFHAYAQGNLCWDAACEAEQATDSVALRVWKEEKQLSPEAAQQRMRNGIYAAIEPSLSGPVRNVLDIGCSVGVGTLALTDWLEQHGHSGVHVSGLDLSPQMLAVAKVRDAGGRIKAWHHRAAEASGLPAASFDLITAQFLCHELPGDASRAVLREAKRLLRPQGVLALVDQDPEAEVIRAMPPALATLLKATEPYLEDYFRLDLPAALAEAGFAAIRRVASDHRHRVLVATCP